MCYWPPGVKTELVFIGDLYICVSESIDCGPRLSYSRISIVRDGQMFLSYLVTS